MRIGFSKRVHSNSRSAPTQSPPTLWHAWDCPFSSRVRFALAEKQIVHVAREVELAEASDELLALNPKGTVPVLAQGELVLSDTHIIAEYIDEGWPLPELMPHS